MKGKKIPKISVVMASYKESPFILKRSIDSILNQTFRDFEFIIIVDNPENKDAISLIQEYKSKDSRIRMFVNKKNIGLAASINRGVKLSKSLYIARQDADDESFSTRLEKQHKRIIEDKTIDVLGTGILELDENKKVLLKRYYKQEVGKEIRRYSPLGHPTVLIKREFFYKYGFYNNKLKSGMPEDYDLWCRWYLKGVKMCNINELLYKYYICKENNKGTVAKKVLLGTIKVKLNYASQLKFSIFDYIYVLSEMFLLLLPTKIVMFLFYFTYKFRNSNR